MTAMLLAIVVSGEGQNRGWGEAYFGKDDMPDGTVYLPRHPRPGTAEFTRDSLQYEWGKSVRETERGAQAKRDADCSPQGMAKYYSGVMGVSIEDSLPALYHLLGRVCPTASNATSRVKRHYNRTRPFVHFGESSLTPDDEKELRRNGSYPSGHTAIGWATALVLMEICPEIQDTLLALGYEFGQSRVICGVHYQSDVDAGRMVGGAVLSLMHRSAEFEADMKAAKDEIAKVTGGRRGRPVLRSKGRERHRLRGR